MSFVFDEVWINNGQLVVGDNNINPPDALGKGAGRVRHSAYIEGPLQVGNAADFSTAQGTVMIGKDGNTNAPVSLHVKGCLLYTSPSPRDRTRSRMPSSA